MEVGVKLTLIFSMKSYYYITNVFPQTQTPKLTRNQEVLFNKIQEYHDETQQTIRCNVRIKRKSGCKTEYNLLQKIKKNLTEHQIQCLKQFIPYDHAKKLYWKEKYEKYKLQVDFLENAMNQITEYDPFFLTMDDRHEIDMLLTNLISIQQYINGKYLDHFR